MVNTNLLPYIVNGITAFLFSCTGPVAIIIAVAAATGLSDQHIASWLFGGFGIAGAVTLWFTLKYRQPIAFAWTIPGTVLLLTSLDHLPFAEAMGAYLVTALLLFFVGISGMAERIMHWVPRPIVMAMVAGVFVDFGLKLIGAFSGHALLASVMVIGFTVVSALPRLQRILPPILVALVAGALVVMASGDLQDSGPLTGYLTVPLLFTPQFSLQAMIELVIPLAVTVLAVQNAQGFAVLTHAGHQPPINAMTSACGIGSIFLALVGSVTMCVTGPSNAILSSNGERSRQFIGGITYGVLAIAFGVFGTLMTWLALKLPEAYIAVLGGLAVIKVLQSAFVSAFSETHSMGALVTLLVTLSGITILNIGAPFWGLVFGGLVSWLTETRSAR